MGPIGNCPLCSMPKTALRMCVMMQVWGGQSKLAFWAGMVVLPRIKDWQMAMTVYSAMKLRCSLMLHSLFHMDWSL